MYTILMNSDKSLVTTVKTMLYQREKLVDKIQFLIPMKYQEIDLTDFQMALEYTDQANVVHAEIMTKDEELYKESYLRYTLPVDTNLTRFAGDIKIRITMTKVDPDALAQYVLHTGDVTITVSPLSNLYHFVPDESLGFVEQMIGELDAKLEAMDKMSGIYSDTQVDDLSITEDGLLQVSSKGIVLGNGVHIAMPENDENVDKVSDAVIDLSVLRQVEL